jgi:probable HAF family extracellular repeat protein
MDLDFAHVFELGRHRALNGARGLAAAFVVGFSALAAGAQTYDVTNLGLGGPFTRIFDINANGQVVGFGSLASGDPTVHAFVATPAGTADIGTLGGSNSTPSAINASGQVIGYSLLAGDSVYHAFSWTEADGMIDLDANGGGPSSPIALNDSGQVVGVRFPAGPNKAYGFFWTRSGGMTDIGTLGGTWTVARLINRSGQVVGSSRLADDVAYHAISWTQAGGMVDLGTLGGSNSRPRAVNASGQIVGDSYVPGDVGWHAFSWTQSGGMVDLGTVGGTTESYAVAITDAGQVVGNAYTPYQVESRGFSWTPSGGMVDLGTLGGDETVAVGVNPSGQVFGYSLTADKVYHAFAWTQSGGIVDLGTLGGSSAIAKAINGLGQIVGRSMTAQDASIHAFLHDGSLKDLNDLAPNKPAGMLLFEAYMVSDSKVIVASSTAGEVLLSPSATTPAAPVVGPISANDPVAVGVSVAAGASFTDANTADTHNAAWTWGDGGSTQAGTVTESGGSGTAKGSHTFAAAGIYPVSLAVTDNTGLTGNVSRNVVVYDPSAGFVTGNGSIHSPLGAFKADPTIAGNATFSFVSKYQKGAKVPVGTTAFQFQSANLDFYSDSYDWMVVAGARGQFKGTGTLDGAAGYKFMLTAIDGQVMGGGGKDRFRIKIWHYDAAAQQDVVDYDNQTDPSTEGTLSEGTVISAGNIVIHTPNK